jgi:ADP-heptose:LPS heptosyltransferase
MKVLLVELWGLGDAVMMTAALRPLLEAEIPVTLLCKPATMELLRPTYPDLHFLTLDAPWTAFQGKYRLWAWPWKKLLQIVIACRRAGFKAAASVRNDPRDHLLMFLAGASARIGFPRPGSGWLLTHRLPAPPQSHRVDLWREIGTTLLGIFSRGGTPLLHESLRTIPLSRPYLNASAYPQHPASGKALAAPAVPATRRPIVGLHCGARIAVRRWKEESFRQIIERLRREADFHLALFPDIDGYGRSLLPLADSCHEALSIPELVADLAACDLILCNDSGPAHIAAALGRPVLAIFGPTNPDWFRPYGAKNHVVIRDICPFRPCFDYCRFPEPICLTELTSEETWPEIRLWFRQHLPAGLPPS